MLVVQLLLVTTLKSTMAVVDVSQPATQKQSPFEESPVILLTAIGDYGYRNWKS